MKNLHYWMDANKLTLNRKKSNTLMINRKLHDKKDFGAVVFNKSEIYQKFAVKYLGIHIDEELNFKYHISFIEAKVSIVCILQSSTFTSNV